MKKLFTLFAAIVTVMAMNATTVTFDFSSASDYGYSNPAAGAFTQVNNGDVLTKDGVTITVNFTSGNGVRFFANTNSGVINLREYIGSTLTISAPAGSTINAISLDGSNLTSTYLSGDITSKEWTGAASTVTMNIIKSTVQINSMVVTLDGAPAAPDTITGTIGEINAMQAASMNTTAYFQTTGKVGTITSAEYGNYYLHDGNDSVMVYGTLDAEGNSKNFASLGINEGDSITIIGKMKMYNNTLEFYDVNVVTEESNREKHKIDFTTANVVASISDNISFTLTGANASLVIEEWETSFAYNNQAMAGTYDISALNPFELTVNGAEVTLVSGSLSVEFVDINADGSQNQYKFKLNATSADGKLYYSDNTIWATVVDHSGNNLPMINDITSIMASKASALAAKLAAGAIGDIVYNIYGYVSVMGTPTKSGDQVFYIADEAGSTERTFYCYGITMPTAPVVGNLVKVVAKLKNYNGTIESDYGTGEIIAALPPYVLYGTTPENVTVVEALAIGADLEDNAVTEKIYRVHGYAQTTYEYNTQYKNQTFFMNDTLNAIAKSDFQAFQCYPPSATDTVSRGCEVVVTGHIMKHGTSIQIKGGSIVILSRPTAIENISATEQKAQKFIENGKVIIVKKGKRFSVLGAEL